MENKEGSGFVDPSASKSTGNNEGYADRSRNYVPPVRQNATPAAPTANAAPTAPETPVTPANEPPKKTTEKEPLPMYQDGEEVADEPRRKGGILSIILIVLLGILSAGFGFYAYKLQKEKKQTEAELTEQKNLIIKDLETLKVSYDKSVEESKANSQHLEEAKTRISQYIDSLRNMKLSVAELAKYKNQVFTLRKERERLLAINDSLRKSNVLIKKQKDSISVALKNATLYADSLASVTTKLKDVVQTGEVLQIGRINTEAVKERSSGKMIPTERAKAANKIRFCFTVSANKIAGAGQKNFYIKVTDPSGNVLGKNQSVSVETSSIVYSVATRFIYQNKSIDVCDFVAPSGKHFEKGKYEIAVFDDKLEALGTAELLLK